jgi:hypothetical protein
MDELWDQIEEHLRIVDSNLGICCQDYCDASIARNELDEAIDKMAQIRLKIEKL